MFDHDSNAKIMAFWRVSCLMTKFEKDTQLTTVSDQNQILIMNLESLIRGLCENIIYIEF